MTREAKEAAKHFGQQLERLMVNEKMTRLDLAAKSGMNIHYLTRVLDGKANLETMTMIRLAQALNCRVEMRLEPLEPETHNAEDEINNAG